jgi:hypothetical protein
MWKDREFKRGKDEILKQSKDDSRYNSWSAGLSPCPLLRNPQSRDAKAMPWDQKFP